MLEFSRSNAVDGPTVVFLHGGGISGWMWNGVVRNLPALDCVAVDLPGHGASRDVPWQSIAKTAEDVWSLVDRNFAGRKIHLVGLSLGSYVGMAMMAARPQGVSAAVLSGMHCQAMKNRWMMKIMASAMAPFTVRPFMARRTAKMFGLGSDDAEAFAREAAKTRVSAIRRAVREVVDYSAPPNMRAIASRTLFVAGGKEHALILNSLPLLAAALPQGRAATAPGLGHGWPGQAPALFAKTVGAQIAGTALPEELAIVE